MNSGPFFKAFGFAVVIAAVLALAGCGGIMPKTNPLRAQQALSSSTVSALNRMGSSPAQGTVLRIYKESKELEVWKQTASGTYKFFKSYEICTFSGVLGPKIKEGDRQSPEGFYTVTPAQLNPNSSYYLSFDTGFPNKFDRAWGRTGTNLMIHGDCSSSGCYSMTDESVAEIYSLVRESFNGGNPSVQLQIYPFRMTPQNLARYASNPNMDYWMNIKEGYDRFELSKTPPLWDVCEKKYVFDLRGANGAALEAAGACPARGSDPLLTALQAKQAADTAEYTREVAAIEARQSKTAEALAAEEATKAAAKARGDAMGGFFSGLFGGGQAQATPPAGQSQAPAGGPARVPAPAPTGT